MNLLIIRKNERNRDDFRNMKLLIFIEIKKTLIIVNCLIFYVLAEPDLIKHFL